ncbi:hypothetical protein Tco_0104907 [Tanacetum coccineum]
MEESSNSYVGKFTVGSTNFAGEELLRSVATRMNKMTGKGDANQTHTTASVSNPNPGNTNPNASSILYNLNTQTSAIPSSGRVDVNEGCSILHDTGSFVGSNTSSGNPCKVGSVASYPDIRNSNYPNISEYPSSEDLYMPKGAPIVDDNLSVKASLNVSNTDDNLVGKVSPSDPIV